MHYLNPFPLRRVCLSDTILWNFFMNKGGKKANVLTSLKGLIGLQSIKICLNPLFILKVSLYMFNMFVIVNKSHKMTKTNNDPTEAFI